MTENSTETIRIETTDSEKHRHNYTWETQSFGIFENKKCSHGLIENSRTTDFGKKYLSRLVGTEITLLALLAIGSAPTGPSLGLLLLAIPVVYLLSKDGFLQNLGTNLTVDN